MILCIHHTQPLVLRQRLVSKFEDGWNGMEPEGFPFGSTVKIQASTVRLPDRSMATIKSF